MSNHFSVSVALRMDSKLVGLSVEEIKMKFQICVLRLKMRKNCFEEFTVDSVNITSIFQFQFHADIDFDDFDFLFLEIISGLRKARSFLISIASLAPLMIISTISSGKVHGLS